MDGDVWGLRVNVSHDLIVGPGRMDGSVEMLVGAGLQDHRLWVQYGVDEDRKVY